jgi:hypothetical protein
MMRLEEFTAETLAQLPSREQASLTLNPLNCKRAPEEMETAALKLLVSHHDYDDAVRYDMIHFFADKATYRALGLLVFSAIFHPGSRIRLHLRNPQTVVRQLVIDCYHGNPADPPVSQLVLIPAAYGYWPCIPDHQHPLLPWAF